VDEYLDKRWVICKSSALNGVGVHPRTEQQTPVWKWMKSSRWLIAKELSLPTLSKRKSHHPVQVSAI
jgi:hypothetical protein